MKVWTLAVAAAAVLLTGCTAVVPAGPAASLKNTSWVVTEIGGEPTLADFQPTMAFGAADEIGGNGGCNGFGGTYTLNGTTIGFSDLFQTQMLCTDNGRDQQEIAFHAALETVVSVRFAGETVELLDGDGAVAVLLAPVPPLDLTGTSWVLSGLIDGNTTSSPAARDQVTLQFTADKVSGKACNSFNGGYTLEADMIKIGPLASTRMACLSEELTAQENLVLEVLQSASSAAVTHGVLEILTADGRGLQFAKA